jgi:hypothetical protein
MLGLPQYNVQRGPAFRCIGTSDADDMRGTLNLDTMEGRPGDDSMNGRNGNTEVIKCMVRCLRCNRIDLRYGANSIW